MNLWKIPNILATKPKFGFAVLLAFVATALVTAQWLNNDVPVTKTGLHRLHKPVLSDSAQLLIQASNNLATSEPLRAKVRLNVNLFAQEVFATGNYSQQGQGRGASRFEVDFGTPDNPQKMLQVCYQGFFYRVKSRQGKQEVQTIDLRQLAENDEQFLFANNSNWMATGGLAGLLENLANNFEFDAAESTTLGDTPVLKLRGRWREESLKRLMFGQVKYSAIKDNVHWHELRGNIPQSCEIILADDDYFPLFPYQIAFFRDKKTETGTEVAETVNLQLYELELNADLPESDFKLNFDGMARTSLTGDFVERIQKLYKIQRSAHRNRNRVNK